MSEVEVLGGVQMLGSSRGPAAVVVGSARCFVGVHLSFIIIIGGTGERREVASRRRG